VGRGSTGGHGLALGEREALLSEFGASLNLAPHLRPATATSLCEHQGSLQRGSSCECHVAIGVPSVACPRLLLSLLYLLLGAAFAKVLWVPWSFVLAPLNPRFGSRCPHCGCGFQSEIFKLMAMSESKRQSSLIPRLESVGEQHEALLQSGPGSYQTEVILIALSHQILWKVKVKCQCPHHFLDRK